jgi:hypothetical protein
MKTTNNIAFLLVGLVVLAAIAVPTGVLTKLNLDEKDGKE